MEPAVGIFSSRSSAQDAVNGLAAVGLGQDCVVFLTPQASGETLDSVPTTDAESPGMGKVLTGLVGGVIGGSAGMGVGSALASLLIPGVGWVYAAGLAAGALLGIGGAAAGAAVGDSTEHAGDEGVPRDDIFFYRELLKQGRSLVIVVPPDEELAVAAHAVLRNYGAEDVETAKRERKSKRDREAA